MPHEWQCATDEELGTRFEARSCQDLHIMPRPSLPRLHTTRVRYRFGATQQPRLAPALIADFGTVAFADEAEGPNADEVAVPAHQPRAQAQRSPLHSMALADEAPAHLCHHHRAFFAICSRIAVAERKPHLPARGQRAAQRCRQPWLAAYARISPGSRVTGASRGTASGAHRDRRRSLRGEDCL